MLLRIVRPSFTAIGFTDTFNAAKMGIITCALLPSQIVTLVCLTLIAVLSPPSVKAGDDESARNSILSTQKVLLKTLLAPKTVEIGFVVAVCGSLSLSLDDDRTYEALRSLKSPKTKRRRWKRGRERERVDRSTERAQRRLKSRVAHARATADEL